MGTVDNIAKELSIGYRRGSKALADKRRSQTTTVRRNSNASSGGGSRKVTSKSSGITKADAVAFNKLSDKARKASKGKIAAFQAAGFGVFEDYSVHTSGKGFGKFFDKTSPKYKKRNK